MQRRAFVSAGLAHQTLEPTRAALRVVRYAWGGVQPQPQLQRVSDHAYLAVLEQLISAAGRAR